MIRMICVCVRVCVMHIIWLFFCWLFALIQKPIETFYENCLCIYVRVSTSYSILMLNLLNTILCLFCSRLVSSLHRLFTIITLANKNNACQLKNHLASIVSIVFDSINLMRFVLLFFFTSPFLVFCICHRLKDHVYSVHTDAQVHHFSITFSSWIIYVQIVIYYTCMVVKRTCRWMYILYVRRLIK